MSDWKKARPILMGGAAIYLIYIAYSLFKERTDVESSMPVWLIYVFSAVFALAAVAVALYALKLWKIEKKKDEEYERSVAEEEAAGMAGKEQGETETQPEEAGPDRKTDEGSDSR